jgi:hypothetical protein
MSAREQLIAARALIADPAKWTQGWFAKTAKGQRVGPEEDKAVCWCVMGALKVTSPAGVYHPIHAPAYPFLSRAAESVKGSFGSPAWVNDTTDHATVLRMFDLAIELAATPASAKATDGGA